MKDIMTLEQLADYLQMSDSTLYRMVEGRKIPAAKIGRQWRFHKEIIDDWLREESFIKDLQILVVDDETHICELFQRVLGVKGNKVFTTNKVSEAIEYIKSASYDIIYLDLIMPEGNGIMVFREIKKYQPDIPVIIITGYPDSELLVEAMELGCFTLLKKPLTVDMIEDSIRPFIK